MLLGEVAQETNAQAVQHQNETSGTDSTLVSQAFFFS